MNIKVLKLSVIVCVCAIIVSCTNDTSNLSSTQLTENSIVNIKNKISEIEIGKLSTNKTIINTDFFDELKSISSQADIEKFHQNFQKKDENTKTTLSSEEIEIYQIYFNSIKENPETSPLIINEVYKSEILLLSIPNFSKQNFINFMDFHHDLLVYLDYESDLNQDDNVMNRTWNCGHRDCLDCCMYTQLKQLYYSDNLIEKIEFFYDPPGNTAWMVGRCAWDCW